MMTRLMTWFIELWNRFNKLKLFKILMIYVLNWVNNLTSWQSISMKHLHSMFSSKLLQSYSENLLSEQHSKSFRLIIIKDDEYWEINDILNFRRYWDQIQYKVKWTNLDKDDEWYYVDKEKFNDSEKVLNEFHKLYSNKSR